MAGPGLHQLPHYGGRSWINTNNANVLRYFLKNKIWFTFRELISQCNLNMASDVMMIAAINFCCSQYNLNMESAIIMIASIKYCCCWNYCHFFVTVILIYRRIIHSSPSKNSLHMLKGLECRNIFINTAGISLYLDIHVVFLYY